MKIFIVIDDYLPTSTRVASKMIHQLAVHMVDQGHDVTVITPDCRISQKMLIVELDGVRVFRFKSGPVKDVNRLVRAINESLLSIRSWYSVKSQIKKSDCDLVISYSPSIFFGGLVKKIKQKCNCFSYLILRDIFPQWAVDSGLIRRNSIIHKYFQYFEKVTYQSGDVIGLMSARSRDEFQRLHPQMKSHVLPNWTSLAVSKNELAIRQEGISSLIESDKVLFFYGGNIGQAQDISNLLRLARSMLVYPEAHFLFVGQGDEVDLLLQLQIEWELNNVSYFSSVDQETFSSILKKVDVGLFSLASTHTTQNFPGKLLGYMQYSLPILGSVNPGNDLKSIINSRKAGEIHTNGDDDSLLQSAIQFCTNKSLRASMGENGRELVIEKFGVASAYKTIISNVSLKD